MLISTHVKERAMRTDGLKIVRSRLTGFELSQRVTRAEWDSISSLAGRVDRDDYEGEWDEADYTKVAGTANRSFWFFNQKDIAQIERILKIDPALAWSPEREAADRKAWFDAHRVTENPRLS
jgi:carboxypeptidase C (cathepsin A)